MPYPNDLTPPHPDYTLGRTESMEDKDVRALLVSETSLQDIRAAICLRKVIPVDLFCQLTMSGEITLDEETKIICKTGQIEERDFGIHDRLMMPNLAMKIDGEWKTTCIHHRNDFLPHHDVILSLYLNFTANPVKFKEKMKKELMERGHNLFAVGMNNNHPMIWNDGDNVVHQLNWREKILFRVKQALNTVKYTVLSPSGLFVFGMFFMYGAVRFDQWRRKQGE